jgi:hypothetical protein
MFIDDNVCPAKNPQEYRRLVIKPKVSCTAGVGAGFSKAEIRVCLHWNMEYDS